MDGWLAATTLWAQATTATGGPGGPVAAADPAPFLALRRWYGGGTLSSPSALPGLDSLGAVGLGVGALLLLALVAQGPGRMLRQLLDVPGHVRLASAAFARLRKAGRLVAVAVGATVVAWTVNQSLSYSDPAGREDLTTLIGSRPLLGLAIEQGVLAGATPLRDLIGLGSVIALVVVAAMLTFQFSTDRWGSVERVISPRASRDAGWGTLAWGAAALYACYRTIGLLYSSSDVPLTGFLGVEVLLVPALMLVVDGLLLGWVAVELRNVGLGDEAEERLDVPGTVGLLPASLLACLLIAPARYASAAVALGFAYAPPLAAGGRVASYVRWQLGWGLIDLQAAAIATLGIAGALAWSRGTLGSALAGYGRLLRAEGGHLAGFLLVAGTVAAAVAGVAYLLVLSLPPQPWVVGAADAYAHYATLPVGLLTLAGLVELGARSLPAARLSEADGTRPS